MSKADGYYEDERPATVGDIRALKAYVHAKFVLTAALLYWVLAGIMFANGWTLVPLVVVVLGTTLLAGERALEYDGWVRKVLQSITFGRLLPSRPPRENREIGERTEERTAEVAD